MPKSFHIVICSNLGTPIKKTVDFLLEKNYTVTIAKSDEDAIYLIKNKFINLIIIELDYMFRDGISLTSDIKNLKEIYQPYIFIFSNKQDDYIQITALNAGADDFIIAPIKPILLEARISRIKKRYLKAESQEIEKPIYNTNFFVDKEQYLIITKKGKISLPRKEFEMVYLMYQNIHKTFTRKDFANLIWKSPDVANTRTIDIHIRNIRKTLGNDIIKTSKGIGYTFNMDGISSK